MQKYFFKCMMLWLLVCSYSALSQVGVNTTNPHPSSALDITSSSRGVLIPRMSYEARVVMTGMENSLLVYDTTKELYYYYKASDGKLYAMNAWTSELTENGANTDTITTTFSKVGIGTKTPVKNLDVVGDIGATKTITAGQTITAGTSISAPKLYGEGAAPVGGIVMWSGTIADIPLGWALCDGSNGTPNLSGRFVVGYHSTDGDYNAPQKVGPVFTDADGTSTGTNSIDAKQVRLTGPQSGVASHTHTATDLGHQHAYWDQQAPQSGTGYDSGGNRDIGWNTDYPRTNVTGHANITVATNAVASATESIENRPPFYVLAYIIKLNY